MKVVVVGNGTSLLKHKHGKFIDNCDVVVRMGGYKIKAYENYVGTKTDFWSNGVSTIKIWKYLENVVNKNIWIVEPEDKFTAHSYLKKWQEIKYISPQYDKTSHQQKLKLLKLANNIEFIKNNYLETLCDDLNMDRYVLNVEGFLRPSLGICTVFMALQKYEHVNIIGFDFLKTGWYWDLAHQHCHTKHNSLMERIWFEKFKNSKRITQHD